MISWNSVAACTLVLIILVLYIYRRIRKGIEARYWKILHDLSYNNVGLLDNSENVGCFLCCSITYKQPYYLPQNQSLFVDAGKTLLCPLCETDTVIPDAGTKHYGIELDRDLLTNMKQRYLGDIDDDLRNTNK